MEFKLGDFVRKKVQEKGLSYKSVADKIGMTPRGLDKMLNGNDMKMSQIIKLSDAIGFDFVGVLYEKEIKSQIAKKEYPIIEQKGSVGNSETRNSIAIPVDKEISFQLNIRGTFDKVQKEIPDFMEAVKEQAELRGLHLG